MLAGAWAGVMLSWLCLAVSALSDFLPSLFTDPVLSGIGVLTDVVVLGTALGLGTIAVYLIGRFTVTRLLMPDSVWIAVALFPVLECVAWVVGCVVSGPNYPAALIPASALLLGWSAVMFRRPAATVGESG